MMEHEESNMSAYSPQPENSMNWDFESEAPEDDARST